MSIYQLSGHDGSPTESQAPALQRRAEGADPLAECAAPGASVAKVALSHGINANIAVDQTNPEVLRQVLSMLA